MPTTPSPSPELDKLIEFMITSLRILTPMVTLDDKILAFLLWLQMDVPAKLVLASCDCNKCDLKDPHDFPEAAVDQLNRWRKDTGYDELTGTRASIEWLKTITTIIELWKRISIFLQKEVAVLST